jgi:hypothetical protein
VNEQGISTLRARKESGLKNGISETELVCVHPWNEGLTKEVRRMAGSARLFSRISGPSPLTFFADSLLR